MVQQKRKILVTGGSGFIGTNLMFDLLNEDVELVNFDKSKPIANDHSRYWFKGNLLNKDDIKNIFSKYNPEVVIHLAARTDTLSNKLEDYIDNTLGTKNLLEIVKQTKSVKRLIITSTQYVYKSSAYPFPRTDEDYNPHTVYGESKMISEQFTRQADLSCCWTIVRPVNIWGPWHMRYPNELWKLIAKGYYLHPGNKEVIRTYGYVKNVVYQLRSITNSPIDIVNNQTYYLGDLPVDSYIWLNGISKELGKKSIRKLPKSFFYLLAKVGDILNFLRIKFPIYTVRYKNMIEDYIGPTNITIHQFGISHPSMLKNIQETIKWIRNEGKEYFPYWNKTN